MTHDVPVYSVWFTTAIMFQGRSLQSVSSEASVTQDAVKLGLTDHGVWVKDKDTEVIVPYYQVKQIYLTKPHK